MRRFAFGVLAAVALVSSVVLPAAPASADVGSLVSDSGVSLDAQSRGRGRGRRSIPEFDATAAGAIGVLLGGAALLLVSRRKKKA